MCRGPKGWFVVYQHVYSKVSPFTQTISSTLCLTNTRNRALIFPAGLVLGFEGFAKTTAEHNIETAYQGAREVLSFFAKQSPQAAHYYEILTSLSAAIAERRNIRAAAAATRGRRYVSKLFSFKNDRPPPEMSRSADAFWRTVGMTSPSQSSSSAVEVVLPPPTTEAAGLVPMAEWSASGRQTMGEGGDILLDFDSLDILQWDNFPNIPY